MSGRPGNLNANTGAGSALPSFLALTAYGAVIPRAFADRAHALQWAEEHGDEYPGCRIVRETPLGPRTIWRQAKPEKAAA